MTDMKFDPGRILGDDILNLSRQELCELVSKLCGLIRAEAGPGAFRGGVYPENISVSPEGAVSLGLSRKTGWEGQELRFIAPELYWNGKRGPASDVYSLGMLLYYAVNGGRLPCDGECEDPQLRRMAGENFKAPRAAGRRLGEIIEKATSFKAEDRYQSVEEMQVMLDSCVKNLYLSGAPSAETIFNKHDDDLSELERIMVGIIERGEEEPAPEEPLPEAPAAEEAPAAGAEAAPEEAAPARAAEAEKAPEEPERVRVYEPAPKKAARPASPPRRQPIPILTEEKNPELEPVIPRQAPVKPAVQYGRSAERERKIAQAAKKRRRRPVALILVLCALLVVAAIIANALLKDFVWGEAGGTAAPENSAPAQLDGENGGPAVVVVPSAPVETQEPEPTEAPKTSSYQVFKEDLSWTEAQARCQEMGGHLAVISDQAEFDKIVALLEDAGLSRAWLGWSRVNGTPAWVTGEEVSFYAWDQGEPSYEDSYDGAAEDYLMLWNHNGWVYNDSRNDPVADYPDWYSGTIGFVCEIEG